MRTALLTVTALVALSSLAIAQDRLTTTEPVSKAKPIDPYGDAGPTVPKVRVNDSGDGRFHYDLPCRVSSMGTCMTEPLPYRPRR